MITITRQEVCTGYNTEVNGVDIESMSEEMQTEVKAKLLAAILKEMGDKSINDLLDNIGSDDYQLGSSCDQCGHSDVFETWFID